MTFNVNDRVKILTTNCLWNDRPGTVTAVDPSKPYPIQVRPDRYPEHRFWFPASELKGEAE